jgi:putative hydroxymethylpyrimidine transport system ATP-binding protein
MPSDLAARAARAPEIRIEKLSFAFGETPLFQKLDFSVCAGQWTCLLGPSGCGKSTLLRLISGGLHQGLSGQILIGSGGDADTQVAWMAQKDLLLPWMSVLENVVLGSRLRGRVAQDVQQRALGLLDRVGLSAYSAALPGTLSGGMRQRTALLRTLMENRAVILMDEPFSALDALTRQKLQDLAAELVRDATVLLVTHDPLEALRLGHRIHVMTGRPVKMSEALIPPGAPPRPAGDSAVAALHQTLLDRLMG